MRYTGPRGKAFTGDKAKAQSLQRMADLLVGRVIKRLKAPPFNGVGYLVDRIWLENGASLGCMVNMVGTHPIVRTWIDVPKTVSESAVELLSGTGPYLECGYLTPAWYGNVLGVPTALDGTIAYTQELFRDYTHGETSAAYLDTMVASAVGAEEYLDIKHFILEPYSPPSRISMASAINEARTGLNDITTLKQYVIDERKITSECTGKLALLWQAMFARKDDFKSHLAEEIFQADSLERTTVLRTKADGSYQLIRITRTALYSADLTLDTIGTILQKYLIHKGKTERPTPTTQKENNKLEAYVLSRAEAMTDWVLVGTLSEAIVGEVFAYGWHANWDGTELTVVTHESVSGVPGEPAYCPLYFIARRYAFNVETLALQTVEQAHWMPQTGINFVWQPWSNGKMRLWTSENMEVCHSVPLVCDAPVYAFYKGNDTVRTVRFKWTEGSANERPSDFDSAFYPGHTFVGDGATAASHSWSRTGAVNGFYIKDDDNEYSASPVPGFNASISTTAYPQDLNTGITMTTTFDTVYPGSAVGNMGAKYYFSARSLELSNSAFDASVNDIHYGSTLAFGCYEGGDAAYQYFLVDNLGSPPWKSFSGSYIWADVEKCHHEYSYTMWYQIQSLCQNALVIPHLSSDSVFLVSYDWASGQLVSNVGWLDDANGSRITSATMYTGDLYTRNDSPTFPMQLRSSLQTYGEGACSGVFIGQYWENQASRNENVVPGRVRFTRVTRDAVVIQDEFSGNEDPSSFLGAYSPIFTSSWLYPYVDRKIEIQMSAFGSSFWTGGLSGAVRNDTNTIINSPAILSAGYWIGRV